MVSPITLAALATAAASFPTGFGFGAGYGSGIRIGYDVIYPAIAPFARDITKGILDSMSSLFGGSGAQSAGTEGAFDFAAGPVDRTERASSRFGEKVELAEVIGDVEDKPRKARARQTDIGTEFTVAETSVFQKLQIAQDRVSDTSTIPRGMTLKDIRQDWTDATKWITINSTFEKYGDWLQTQ